MMFFVMMFLKEKNNKLQKNTRSLELSLSLFRFIFQPPTPRRELFGFVCSKHSIKVYSYHLHDDAEKLIILSKRKKKQK